LVAYAIPVGAGLTVAAAEVAQLSVVRKTYKYVLDDTVEAANVVPSALSATSMNPKEPAVGMLGVETKAVNVFVPTE